MSNYSGIRVGSKSDKVVQIKKLLAKHGAYRGNFNQYFGAYTESCVKTFQVQHIGPDGKYLRPTGKIDADTEWALLHASGEEQHNRISPLMPIMEGEGIGKRKEALRLAIHEHEVGVHEEPDGSNWGPEIKKYGGQSGWPWCALGITWVLRQAKVIAYREAGTWNLLQRAIRNGQYVPVSVKLERLIWAPGNLLIWQHQKKNGTWTRTGHVAMILRVEVKNDLVTRINTIGFNEGNRVKAGLRVIWESDDLVAIVNPFDDVVTDIEYDIIPAANLKGVHTR